jgi:RimJ/RimL family protein N-acetyltransferase
MSVVLETSRLVLREVTDADDTFVFALMNEPAYLQHIGDRGIRTLENARSYIRDKFVANYAKWGFGHYLVELKGPLTPLGICGFVRRDTLEHPDIGFAFASEYRSHGFGYEAGKAMLEYGFDRLGFGTVLGLTSPANQPSIRLLEKLGLRYQKTIRVPPNDRDSLVFTINRMAPN